MRTQIPNLVINTMRSGDSPIAHSVFKDTLEQTKVAILSHLAYRDPIMPVMHNLVINGRAGWYCRSNLYAAWQEEAHEEAMFVQFIILSV